MKLCEFGPYDFDILSPPARGAWIETADQLGVVIDVDRRPPRGGRGLKLEHANEEIPSQTSPPARGAWIETSLHLGLWLRDAVAPRAGGVD